MYDELKEKLYTNLTTYLDSLQLGDEVVYDVCWIVDKSFEETFFSAAPKTLDIDTPRW